MKYFIDTEFLEGTQKEAFPISLFRKQTPPTIDLISIGIVAEDTDAFSKRIGVSDRTYNGREYYAISKDFNLKEAWNRYDLLEANTSKNHSLNDRKNYWIRENVLKPIWQELCNWDEGMYKLNGDLFFGKTKGRTIKGGFTYNNLKKLINKYGKTNKQIAEEIIKFINSEPVKQTGTSGTISQLSQESIDNIRRGYLKPEFYGYYCDYDWVAFCWLFGKMIDLPTGFPMYCHDLKQELDNKAFKLKSKGTIIGESIEEKVEFIKHLPYYPKQTNEHHALSDSRWNRKLYEFLNTL